MTSTRVTLAPSLPFSTSPTAPTPSYMSLVSTSSSIHPLPYPSYNPCSTTPIPSLPKIPIPVRASPLLPIPLSPAVSLRFERVLLSSVRDRLMYATNHEEGVGGLHEPLELVLPELGLRRGVEEIDGESLQVEKKKTSAFRSVEG